MPGVRCRCSSVASFTLAVSAVFVVAEPSYGQCVLDPSCDDGLFCTNDLLCNDGSCTHASNSCSDGLFCNGSEVCNEDRDVCEFACVGGTICDSGFCVCNDGSGCPDGNVGQECSIFVQPPSCPKGTVCNETLNQCTECASSSDCTTSPELRCKTSTGECVECLSDSHCNDSSFCNGQETCNQSTGFCEDGDPVSCDFGEFCSDLRMACVECEFNVDCNDGLFCNGQEFCQKSDWTCQPGEPEECKSCFGGANHGEPCEDESDCPDGDSTCRSFPCDETSDSCSQCSDDADCKICVGGDADGRPCNNETDCPEQDSTCRQYLCKDSTGMCVQCLQNSQCSDPDWCTDNLCINDSCTFLHNNNKCSDSLFCNGAERCIGGIANPDCNPTTGAGCCFFACLGGGTCDPGTKQCVGGTNPGTPCDSAVQPPSLSDGIACTDDVCDEVGDVVTHTPNDDFCDDSSFCNGAETCQPTVQGSDIEGCLAGTTVDCSAMATVCRTASCDNTQEKCVTSPRQAPPDEFLVCDDEDPCTAASICSSSARTCSNDSTKSCTSNTQCPARSGVCSNAELSCTVSEDCPEGGICGGGGTCASGVCVEEAPEPDDPYRCIRLEWRNVSPPIYPGETATVDLYAVADGCNVISAQDCPATQHEILGLSAILTWNEGQLELKPAAPGDPNPQDPCNPASECDVCPVNQNNWDQSTFFSDCEFGDALNEPCTGATPGNDGDALYTAISLVPEAMCGLTPPACVTEDGLYITRFKFQALRSGTAQVAIGPCAGDVSRTRVTGATLAPDGYVNSEVLRDIGPDAEIVVLCDSHDDCDDGNECTSEACSCTTADCGGTCEFTNVSGLCDNGLFCDGTDDMCNSGTCEGSSSPCTDPGLPFCDEANDRCVECLSASDCEDFVSGQPSTPNVCTEDICNLDGLCENPPIDCSDGADCTTDTCEVVVDPPNVTAVCNHEPDDALCDTGLFCSAQRCETGAGCVFDHECFSSDGNPCPDGGACDEATDTCGGCLPPTAVAAGGRYLSITPGDQGSTPVALFIEGDCADAEVSCVSGYVQSLCAGGLNDGQVCSSDADCPKSCASGPLVGEPCDSDLDCNAAGGACQGACETSLGQSPTFLTAAEWSTVAVTNASIRPSTGYKVLADCDLPGGRTFSAAADVTTWKWGDVDGNSTVTVVDIGKVVEVVKGVGSTATFEGANVAPCVIDDTANVIDIATVVDALKGLPNPCAAVCP